MPRAPARSPEACGRAAPGPSAAARSAEAGRRQEEAVPPTKARETVARRSPNRDAARRDRNGSPRITAPPPDHIVLRMPHRSAVVEAASTCPSAAPRSHRAAEGAMPFDRSAPLRWPTVLASARLRRESDIDHGSRGSDWTRHGRSAVELPSSAPWGEEAQPRAAAAHGPPNRRCRMRTSAPLAARGSPFRRSGPEKDPRCPASTQQRWWRRKTAAISHVSKSAIQMVRSFSTIMVDPAVGLRHTSSQLRHRRIG